MFSIERETTCWLDACRKNVSCDRSSLYCDSFQKINTFINDSCPIQDEKNLPFKFGIFLDALQSGVVKSTTDFPQKFFYCFWWGLRNLRFALLILVFFALYLCRALGFYSSYVLFLALRSKKKHTLLVVIACHFFHTFLRS